MRETARKLPNKLSSLIELPVAWMNGVGKVITASIRDRYETLQADYTTPLYKTAAYGREQSDIRISHDQWAELVARHPETMQVLFGGASHEPRYEA